MLDMMFGMTIWAEPPASQIQHSAAGEDLNYGADITTLIKLIESGQR